MEIVNHKKNIDLLTPKQVSEILQVSLVSIYRWLKEGYLPSIKIGRGRRIRRKDLEEFIEIHSSEGPPKGIVEEAETIYFSLLAKYGQMESSVALIKESRKNWEGKLNPK